MVWQQSHGSQPWKNPPSFKFQTPKKAYFGGTFVESSSSEKLLGSKIDSDLTFEEHISSIRNKLAKKINVLSGLVNYMSLDKRRMVMKAFIESQLNYCPWIWIFHSRTLNSKTKRLHERALRNVYFDCKSSFCELLEKDNFQFIIKIFRV